MASLEALAAGLSPFGARLEAVGRFPGTAWLRPDPDGAFRRLTEAVARRWPEAPPYGGQFDDVVPHLTVADRQPEHVLRAVAGALEPRLPVAFRVDALSLHVFDGARWVRRRVVPLGGSPT
jgi:2'-5' RNA ligase